MRENIPEDDLGYIKTHEPWELQDNGKTALRHIDHIVVKRNGTLIPLELKSFFGVESLKMKEKKHLAFLYDGKVTIKAEIVVEQKAPEGEISRMGLFWGKNFSKIVEKSYDDGKTDLIITFRLAPNRPSGYYVSIEEYHTQVATIPSSVHEIVKERLASPESKITFPPISNFGIHTKKEKVEPLFTFPKVEPCPVIIKVDPPDASAQDLYQDGLFSISGDRPEDKDAFSKGIDNLRRAAELGHTGAKEIVGEKDFNKMLMVVYQRAAELGCINANYLLGNSYYGAFVKKDPELAKKYYLAYKALGGQKKLPLSLDKETDKKQEIELPVPKEKIPKSEFDAEKNEEAMPDITLIPDIETSNSPTDEDSLNDVSIPNIEFDAEEGDKPTTSLDHSNSWHVVSDICATRDCDVSVKIHLQSLLAKNEKQIILSFFSWDLVPDVSATKNVDTSALKHNDSDIPLELAPFFHADLLNPGQKLEVTLLYNGTQYVGQILKEQKIIYIKTPRSRLFWDANFGDLVRSHYDEKSEENKITFIRVNTDDNLYDITFSSNEVLGLFDNTDLKAAPELDVVDKISESKVEEEEKTSDPKAEDLYQDGLFSIVGDGPTGKASHSKGFESLRRAAALGHNGAKEIVDEKSYNKKMMGISHRAAELGGINAHYLLGESYYYGRYVTKDRELAKKYYLAYKALGGQKKAPFSLNKDVDKDPVKALEWYTKAAERGYVDSQFNLGVCYENGEGVKKDPVKELEWYTKATACDLDVVDKISESKVEEEEKTSDPTAQTLYQDGLFSFVGDGPSGTVYYSKGLHILRSAAELGHTGAKEIVGEKNYNKQRMKIYHRAAELGGINANYLLGESYYFGRYVTKDLELAKKYYLAYTTLGGQKKVPLSLNKEVDKEIEAYKEPELDKKSEDATAQTLYEDGLFTIVGDRPTGKASYSKGFNCLCRAAKLGHTGAKEIVGEKDYNKKRMKIYHRAAELGGINAHYLLGDSYYYGRYVEKDLELAKKYYLTYTTLGGQNKVPFSLDKEADKKLDVELPSPKEKVSNPKFDAEENDKPTTSLDHSNGWQFVSDICVTRDCDVGVKERFHSLLKKNVHAFFGVVGLKVGDKKEILVTYQETEYISIINTTRSINYSININLWFRPIKPFVAYLKDVSEKELLTKKLVFEKTGLDKYKLSIQDKDDLKTIHSRKSCSYEDFEKNNNSLFSSVKDNNNVVEFKVKIVKKKENTVIIYAGNAVSTLKKEFSVYTIKADSSILSQELDLSEKVLATRDSLKQIQKLSPCSLDPTILRLNTNCTLPTFSLALEMITGCGVDDIPRFDTLPTESMWECSYDKLRRWPSTVFQLHEKAKSKLGTCKENTNLTKGKPKETYYNNQLTEVQEAFIDAFTSKRTTRSFKIIDKHHIVLEMSSPYPPTIKVCIVELTLSQETKSYDLSNLSAVSRSSNLDVLLCGYIPDKKIFVIWDLEYYFYKKRKNYLSIPISHLEDVTYDMTIFKNIGKTEMENVLLSPAGELRKSIRGRYDQKAERDRWNS